MKTFRLILFTVFCLGWLSMAAQAADTSLEFKAILILAKNGDGPSDKRLNAYEPQLSRLFNFTQYTHMGEGLGTARLPGNTQLNLGAGYQLNVQAESSGKQKYRLHIQWKKGKQLLLKTTIVAKRNVPTILGGPRHEEGNLIVVIVVNK